MSTPQITDPCPNCGQTKLHFYKLYAAVSNYFLAKDHLTLPERYHHEQVLRKVLADLSEHYTP
jgi:hypothetical protein